jgi:hypothetical protein
MKLTINGKASERLALAILIIIIAWITWKALQEIAAGVKAAGNAASALQQNVAGTITSMGQSVKGVVDSVNNLFSNTGGDAVAPSGAGFSAATSGGMMAPFDYSSLQQQLAGQSSP